LVIIKQLLDRGAKVKVFDPIAKESAKRILGNSVVYEDNLEDSLKNADALVIVTEWPEFKEVDLKMIKAKMKTAYVVDGRNAFSPKEMRKQEIKYISVGR